jgi:ribosomal protein L2
MGQTAVPFVELRPAPLGTPAPARGPEVELVGVQGDRMVIRLAAGQHLDLPALAKAFQGRWA